MTLNRHRKITNISAGTLSRLSKKRSANQLGKANLEPKMPNNNKNPNYNSAYIHNRCEA